MTYAIVFALLIWSTALSLTFIGTWLGVMHYRNSSRSFYKATSSDFPPISILKPLKGLDEGSADNLESFFQLRYPLFEILFTIADPRDPIRSIVEELIKRYPSVQARLIIGDVDVGFNPKINNLIISYNQAQYDWLLISDSNVRARHDFLSRHAAYIEPDVGIISAMIGGQFARNFAGSLEKVFLNTFYARWGLLSTRIGHPVVVGKSMLFKKSVFESFGGLTALSAYLAEDYVAGLMTKKMGMRLILMHEPVYQYVGKETLRLFWLRHIRWGLIRKTLAPSLFLIELFLTSIVSGILGAWMFHSWFEISPLIFLPLHFGFWCLCDMLLMFKVEGRLTLQAPWHWMLREILHIPLWIGIASGNKVDWRGKRLIVTSGTRLQLLPEKNKP